MNLTSSFITFWTRRANSFIFLLFCVYSCNTAVGQLTVSVDLGRNYYTSNGGTSRFNYQGGNASGKNFLRIYQNDLLMGSATLQYEWKKNCFTAGVERNSITFNKQPFQKTGQLIRSFWFSVLTVGVGRTWTITPPEATKIKLSLNAYGFTILNKSGVEKNSFLYFNPPTNLNYEDRKRESFSIRSSPKVGLGINGKLIVYPKLKNRNISIFAKADVSITSFFVFAWNWQEDGYPKPTTDTLDSHRRSLTFGISYMLSKVKKGN